MSQNGRKSVKKLVIKTLENYSVTEITAEELKRIILANGYTLVCFESNEKPQGAVFNLMRKAGVLEKAKYLDTFTCSYEERHFAFLKKDVSEKRYFYGLCNILGGIIVKNEYGDGPDNAIYAGEFAYRLAKIQEGGIIYNQFTLFPKRSIAAASAFLLLITFSTERLLSQIPNKSTFTLLSSESAVNALAPQTPETTKDSGTVKDAAEVFAYTGAASPENEEKPEETVPDGAENIVNGENGEKEELQTQTDAAETVQTVFYATKSGKKYHVEGCSYIEGKDTVIVTESDIKSGKYTPCSRCIG
ncbi:MAG: hypothetical protein J6036_03920 [Clostridia bacterium]|nr:hypothetical protein [Clostridia bacterium]